jgi:hypothetical protein
MIFNKYYFAEIKYFGEGWGVGGGKLGFPPKMILFCEMYFFLQN